MLAKSFCSSPRSVSGWDLFVEEKFWRKECTCICDSWVNNVLSISEYISIKTSSQRCSVKEDVLKNFLISRENTYLGVSF